MLIIRYFNLHIIPLLLLLITIISVQCVEQIINSNSKETDATDYDYPFDNNDNEQQSIKVINNGTLSLLSDSNDEQESSKIEESLPIHSDNNNSAYDQISNNSSSSDSSKLLSPSSISSSGSASPPPVKLVNKSSPKKRKVSDKLPVIQDTIEWKCPNITRTRNLECGCDLPHTLRCSGDIHGLEILAKSLRESPYTVSLLDCTLKNVTFLSDARIFENVSLHGLVISSGEIKRVHKSAFLGLSSQLQALGLPSNALLSVPWNPIAPLTSLERLDLSNNKIKVLGTTDFSNLINLNYLELSDNQISSISLRTFTNLKKLEVLKLGGNRVGDFPTSLQAIGQCISLRHLDLKANSINGPLTDDLLPPLRNLEFLNLERNLIKSIQNKALKNFTKLTSLSLRHNQIDVLQDHAFFGLTSLQLLDLSYNGIVAVSSASLQHLARLTRLDLTHNFLRALTSDLIVPLPSLRELKLAGNDISIVAKNALDGAKELTSLSLEENPLSCDCTIRSFAEWLQESKISPNDLLSATCVTPPKLEGAPLIQVPLQSLHCDMDNLDLDNANIIEQLEAISQQNYSMHISDLSEMITLRDLHFSPDYGLILTWTVNLSKDDYTCDAIYVYKEEDVHEILIDNSPIQCESKVINGQNTVSVIVPDSSKLNIGDSYRFCLVLVQGKNIKTDLIVGCSNITRLQSGDVMNDGRYFRTRQFSSSNTSTTTSSSMDEENTNSINNRKLFIMGSTSSSSGGIHHSHPYNFLNDLNKSFIPGLGLGILITSVFVLLWGAMKIRKSTQTIPAVTTCYAASERMTHLTETDNGSRYLKLQATTAV